MNKTILILVFIISCFGCKKDSLKDTDLLKTKWILSYIQDTKTQTITNYPGDAAKRISIVFNDPSDIISFSGICNGGAGTYTYSSITGEIKVTDLITTLIGCKYDEWETYTVQNLYYASNYKISGNNLAIYTNGAYNLYFTRTNYGGGMVNLIIAGSTNGDKVTVRTYGDGVISDENVELDSRKNLIKML